MRFQNMPYRRIGYNELERRYQELIRDFQAAPDATACMDVLLRRDALNADSTPMELCYVRHDMDVNDPFYAAEQAYYDEIGPRIADLSSQLDALIVTSPFCGELEKITGSLALTMMGRACGAPTVGSFLWRQRRTSCSAATTVSPPTQRCSGREGRSSAT